MTNEERNTAQDILDNLLRDEYMRGVADSKSESESIIKKLEEQNELMLAALKRITEYTKWVVAEHEFRIYGRKISIEERDLHGSWHDAIHESCGAIAYVEGEEE